jgi:hypothetical protein
MCICGEREDNRSDGYNCGTWYTVFDRMNDPEGEAQKSTKLETLSGHKVRPNKQKKRNEGESKPSFT